MTNINYTELRQRLDLSKNIVITSHQSPDGDAIGSALALFSFLKKLNIKSTVILPDEFPKFYNWMEGASDVVYFDSQEQLASETILTSDLIFSLDYNDLKRVGKMGDVITNSSAFKIMIDHHLFPSDFADVTISDSNICSTAQMIFEFIENIGEIDCIDDKIGACIYTGLVTDTGSFRFESVSSKTHDIVSFLIKKGLKHHLIHEAIFNQNSVERIKLRGHILSNSLECLPELKTSIISLSIDDSKKFNVQSGDTEGLVNTALSIQGTQVAAFFREADDKIKISFRSIGDVKVNELSAKYFSGGGHKNAAGGMSKLTLTEAIELYKSVVHEII